jgi:hypothetical protein
VNSGDVRERAIERVLRQPAVKTGVPLEDCLDAETLAAWVDGSLTKNEAAVAESHVSTCARCQAVAATLVRSEPGPEGAEAWWRRGRALGWLVPLTAGAVAVALWVATPDVPLPSPSEQADATTRVARENVPSQPNTQAADDRMAVPTAESAAASNFEATPQPASKPGEASGARDADQSAVREAERTDASDGRAAGSLGAEQGAFRAENNEMAKAASAPPAASEERVLGATQTETLSQIRARQALPTREIVSPDASVRWRLGAPGAVEYSTDSGTSWENQSTGVAVELTAGTSPSSSVCWLVGRAGTVLLTTDSRRWQRIPFPEPVDLVGVVAVDAQTATVSTADGRTFRTSNAGTTWALQGF